MTAKRFNFVGGYLYYGDKAIGHVEDVKFRDDFEKLLNDLYEEKEYWKEIYKQELEKNSIMTVAYDKQGNAHILPKRVD